MATAVSLEDRGPELERTVADLRRQVANRPQGVMAMAGGMKDFPEFLEVTKAMQENGESERRAAEQDFAKVPGLKIEDWTV